MAKALAGKRPFVILALPRSRTAWLAHYLNRNQEFPVGHDVIIECDSIEQFLGSFANGMIGTVETGAVLAWQLLQQRLPGVQLVTLHRPLEEVLLSLARFGIAPDEAELEAREAMLEVCAGSPGVESLDWIDLDDPECCKWLFELCLGEAWDSEWHQTMSQLNIQIDMLARSKRLWQRRQELAGLRQEVLVELAKIPEGTRAWMT